MKRKLGSALALMAVLVLVSGCIGSGRLTPAAQKQLHGAADTAEARAKNFKAWSGKVKAKDVSDEVALQSILVDHGKGLDSQAKALRDLSDTIKTK